MFDKELQQYLLPDASVLLEHWCNGYRIKLVVKPVRASKLGDYRQLDMNTHQITFNLGMTPELTFFTLTHEIAHMHTRVKYGGHVKSHGNEWKYVFAKLLLESLHIYPKIMHSMILRFAKSPKASFYASKELANHFIKSKGEEQLLLKEIPNGAKFRIKQKVFEKGNIRKIRYLCKEISTKKMYTIHMLAPVDEVFED